MFPMMTFKSPNGRFEVYFTTFERPLGLQNVLTKQHWYNNIKKLDFSHFLYDELLFILPLGQFRK